MSEGINMDTENLSVDNCTSSSYCKGISNMDDKSRKVWDYLYYGGALYDYCETINKSIGEFACEIGRYLKDME